jgi:AhpD family alkylhydroperoxidase
MARLPYVEAEAASEEVRSLLKRLPDLRIYRMVAHAETAFRPFLRFGNAILARQKLSALHRELAILRVANLSGSAYEWTQHVEIARRAGATDDQIEAIERGELDGAPFDDEERLVLQFTTELVEKVRVSDSTFRNVAARFTPRETVELVLAVGYYMMIARLLETTDVDLDAPATDEFVRSMRR